MKKHLTFGFELETGLEGKDALNSLPCGDYHEPITLNEFWRCEHDGSLHVGYEERNENYTLRIVELTTPTFTLDQLPFLEKTFKSLLAKYEIERIILNDSMGAHVHFSLPENNFYHLLPIETMKKIRVNSFDFIKKTYPETFGLYYRHYFRSYAKRLTKRNYGRDRYQEFNFTSNTGAEWRSFNLLHLQPITPLERTTKEIFRSLSGALKILENTILTDYQNGFSFENSIKMHRNPEIKKITDDLNQFLNNYHV